MTLPSGHVITEQEFAPPLGREPQTLAEIAQELRRLLS